MSSLLAMLGESVVLGIAYLVLHETLHYIAARMLGYTAELSLASDSLLPSPSVTVHDSPSGWRRLAILYSPYVLNVVFMLSGVYVAKLIGLLTLPNVLLEEEAGRAIRLPIAIGLQLFITCCYMLVLGHKCVV